MPDVHDPASDQPEEVAKPTQRGRYYLNTRTGEVEEGKVSGALSRLGPYDTREEAAAAYDRAAARNEAWEEADKAWDEDDDGDQA